MSAPIISIANLSKVFSDSTQALKNIHFQVETGTLTALVGPDGAGKTTLLRLIAGLLKPTAGQINVLGLDVIQEPQAVQDLISYMPQKFGLYEDLSVQENLDLYADLHGVFGEAREKRYKQLLQMTNLTNFVDRLAGRLSGGMKQKLGLACTLVRSPQLLLLDEPTVGVDPLSRAELWEIINNLIEEESLSVLVSTAYLDEAERCKKVYILHEGELLVCGTPTEISQIVAGNCFLLEANKITDKLHSDLRKMQVQLLDQTDAIIDAVPQRGGLRFVLKNKTPADNLKTVVSESKSVSASLEDAFMFILKGSTKSACNIAYQNNFAQHYSNNKPEKNSNHSPASQTAIIQVKNLVRTFGDFVAVNNTTFSVNKGEIFGLLGPNGAGKTTTFRILCGLLPASSGSVEVAGVNLRTAPSTARKNIGYVAQKFSLYGNLSVKENLEFFAGLYSLDKKYAQKRIQTVLAEFDLAEQLHVASGTLPGGYKQRLAMAIGLLHEPEILFLDEPTSGIDPLARRMFWRRITALADSGITIVITTHFLEEAEYCDRIVIQDAGEILALGTPQAVREQVAVNTSKDEPALSMEEAFIQIVKKNRHQIGANQC